MFCLYLLLDILQQQAVGRDPLDSGEYSDDFSSSEDEDNNERNSEDEEVPLAEEEEGLTLTFFQRINKTQLSSVAKFDRNHCHHGIVYSVSLCKLLCKVLFKMLCKMVKLLKKFNSV